MADLWYINIMKEKTNLPTTKGIYLAQFEYGDKEVGTWTPINTDGVVGEFKNHRSVTKVIRCETQVESMVLPTQDQVDRFNSNMSTFQKGINTNDANG